MAKNLINQCARLQFSTCQNTSDQEIEELYQKTKLAQEAVKDFLDDNISTKDLTDIFKFCQINPEAFEQAFLENLSIVYGRAFTIACRD